MAVAYASMKLGIPAKTFVPRIPLPSKIQRILIIEPNSSSQVTDTLMLSRRARSGHSNQERSLSTPTTSGQYCWAREPWGWRSSSKVRISTPSLSRLAAVDLSPGIAAWFAGRVRVVGVEPEASPTLTMALKAGAPVDARTGTIAADSLAPRRVRTVVYPIAKRYVDHVVLVAGDEISRPQLALWDICG